MAKYHYYKVSEIKKHSAYFYFHNYRPSLSLFAFRKRFPPNPEFKIAAGYRFQELWFPPDKRRCLVFRDQRSKQGLINLCEGDLLLEYAGLNLAWSFPLLLAGIIVPRLSIFNNLLSSILPDLIEFYSYAK